MATVRDLIHRALRKGRVVGEGQTPSPELVQDALDELMDLASMWAEVEGIENTLPNSTLDTVVDEPRVVRSLIVYELAVLMAEEMDIEVPAVLARARDRRKGLAQSYFLNDMRTGVDPALLPLTQPYDIGTS